MDQRLRNFPYKQFPSFPSKTDGKCSSTRDLRIQSLRTPPTQDKRTD